ncbi:restriction endonuclease subunit S [Marinobacter daepoensis]|uniref:Restriction endonuclease subunit S n=1 Tax=Marinobacter daepoensis TaxID=262077 RepID=A0ABS3BEG2_9GAMM|nr:restriction endonuclease subunit S [Marinobacter daepoensis]MBN7768605.1 restriction endonuclease subunit S [Marinobacter daepoensis]MBY6079342.1 restriction endonuclease subunit S [Marinobacter daepoensis]
MASEWTLEELGKIVTGKTPPKSIKNAYSDSGIPFVTPKDMDGRKWIATTERSLSNEGVDSVRKSVVPAGSVSVSCIGSDMGKAVRISVDSVTNQQINTLIPDTEKCDPDYLYYLLSTMQQDLKDIAGGSATPILNKGHFGKVRVFLPDIWYQNQAAKVLSVLDDKIQLNHQINQSLEQMAQAIFKSWFVDFEPVKAKIAALEAGDSEEDALLAAMQAISGKDEAELTRLQAEQPEQYAELRATAELFPSAMQDSELGAIPEGWTIAPFSNIARLDTTSVKPAQDPEKVWEHYSIPAFDEGATPAFETGTDIKSNKYKVYPTAVLSSKLNPHFPRTWIPDVQNPDAAICSTEFMQFVPLEPQHRAFIAGMVTSEPFQSGIMMRVTGSTGSRQRAQPKQVAAMDIILPKNDLRAVYSQHTAAMYRMQSKNIWQARSLANLRDTLLPKLLSGELSIPNAMVEAKF